MAAGKIRTSRLLRKLASYPRQNDLAAALREVGRIERTLFIIEWILDTDMQRRAQIGLNKGEAHHALKNALRIGRQGEIRDRTTEGQHYRIAGLNLVSAVIIYWNTVHLGRAVVERRNEGLDVPPELLARIRVSLARPIDTLLVLVNWPHAEQLSSPAHPVSFAVY